MKIDIIEAKKIIDDVKNKYYIENDIIIPNEIMKNKELKVNEKIYLCQYLINNYDINLTDQMMRLSKNQLRIIKKRLKKLNYIFKNNYSPEELKQKTIKLSHKGLKCEWCGKESYILHKHHFPICKSDGGKEIVNICPNCHYTFHKLEEE